jgi:simple sugar transport system ATP-binding protein
VAALTVADTTPEEIVRLMVGRDVVLPTLAVELKDLGRSVPPVETPPQGDGRNPAPGDEPPERETAGAVLRIRDVSLPASGRGCALRGITLDVAPGEILGIAGVEGNGQSELVEAITGLRAPRTGSIAIAGTDVTGRPPRECFAAGLACIPEDRQRQALILDFSLRENLMLGRHREPGARGRFSNASAAATLEEFTVRPPDPRAPATQLSGGNQQKVVVAREFTRTARVLVAAQPTRGIDLGAIEFIHRRLLELRAQGMAILLVSAELTEILALSDRVAVMYGGRVVFEAPNRGLTERDLGAPMAGAGTEHAHG